MGSWDKVPTPTSVEKMGEGGRACQMVPSLDCWIDVRETQRLMPSCNDTAVAIASEVKNRQLHSPGFEQYKCGPKKLKLKEDADFENIQT